MTNKRSKIIPGLCLMTLFGALSGQAFAKEEYRKTSVLAGLSFLNATQGYTLGVYQLNGQGNWGFGAGLDFGKFDENPDGGYYLRSDFIAAKLAMTYGVTDNIYIAPNIGIVHSQLDRSYYYAGRPHTDSHTANGITPGVEFIVENNGWTGSVGISHLPLVDRNETAFSAKVGWSF
ncbi:hypothetical protein ACPV4B_04635 [Vibrio parahaemolyticus]